VRTIAITGAASGMGAAPAARLGAAGDRVVGVDLRDVEVIADLGSPDGRRAAIDAVAHRSRGRLDGLVTFAGLGPGPSRLGSVLASVNYFGTVELLAGLRPALAAGSEPAAVAISSNSTSCQPAVPLGIVAACLDGDESRARALADDAGSVATYPATKIGVARWVRRHAPQADWAGAGIRLNAVAPGLTETAMVAEGRQDPELAAALEQFPIPVGRAGEPTEIAALVAFLLGPEARFFCGSVLFCDGGTDALLRADDWPAPWDVAVSAFMQG
jgi:NAD(P)-dependent dehydrogenase (short-subunit alcohol dehydrogenase family)